MQRRILLLTLTLVAAALAGCAENGVGDDGSEGGSDATPPAMMSESAAAALFAQAAGDLPERYGVKMSATKNGTELMTGEAVFDKAAQTSFFRMSFDESLMEGEEGGMGSEMFAGLGAISMYGSPQGNAMLVNGTVIVTAPEEPSPLEQSAGENSGFGAIAAPEDMLAALRDENVTVESVTPTTLRGKGALKVEMTYLDPETNTTQEVTAWLFQNPARVARLEMVLPESTEGDDSFGGALMAVEMLYDREVTLDVPPGLSRAIGMRWESNRERFSFGFGDEDDGPEVWTFQTSGGIALSEVLAEVGAPAEPGDLGEPEWSMALSAGTMTQNGVTLTFDDADGDGLLSANDTLTIVREDGAEASVSLKDTVSGYRVVPGAGLWLAGLALAGVALLARRR